jgi:hypothetical protein
MRQFLTSFEPIDTAYATFGFILAFVLFCLWTFRSSGKNQYEQISKLPFDEESK